MRDNSAPVLPGEPGDTSTPADHHWRNEVVRRLEPGIGQRPELSYAIAGAFAMRVHGYARATAGIDVFVIPETLPEFTYSLRKPGGLQITVVSPELNYATLPGDDSANAARRITIHIPESIIDLDAIEAAVPMPCRTDATAPLRVIPCEWLAASKILRLAESKDARHAADLQSMLVRKMFDPDRVRQLLASRDPGEWLRKGFDQLLEKFAGFRNSCWPQKRKPPRPRKPKPKRH